MARLGSGLKNKVRSLIARDSGLSEISIDDLATSSKLQSWEAVQIPERLKFSSKPKGEVLRLWLRNKRGFADGFHRCEFVARDEWRVRVRIGSRKTTVPCEIWDRALAKWHGREYIAPGT